MIKSLQFSLKYVDDSTWDTFDDISLNVWQNDLNFLVNFFIQLNDLIDEQAETELRIESFVVNSSFLDQLCCWFLSLFICIIFFLIILCFLILIFDAYLHLIIHSILRSSNSSLTELFIDADIHFLLMFWCSHHTSNIFSLSSIIVWSYFKIFKILNQYNHIFVHASFTQCCMMNSLWMCFAQVARNFSISLNIISNEKNLKYESKNIIFAFSSLHYWIFNAY